MFEYKYNSLVVELSSCIQKYKEVNEIQKNAEFDLKWRLTQLFKEVKEEDEQKFVDIAGMSGQLLTSLEKRQKAIITKSHYNEEDISEDVSELIQIDKNRIYETWAKSIYRRAVRRCHPDTIKVSDKDYKHELTLLYKDITEAYENSNLDILMVETYKLFIKPKQVIRDQIEILESSKKRYNVKIKSSLTSQGYAWSTFSDEKKETYLINLMKQQGVKFVDKHKVKEVLSRRVSKRKVGERPENSLRTRLKSKK
jgi:hypothetical protein